MDEGDGEDKTAVSRAQDIRSQGKDGSMLPENCNILESRGRVILWEGDQPRSSIQQFVDILDGKDPISDLNAVDRSQNPRSGYGENVEGRVQELRLGHYGAGHGTSNEGEMLETMLNEWQQETQHGVGVEAGSSVKRPMNNEKRPATSTASEDLRPANVFAEPTSDQNAYLDLRQSSHNGSGAVLRDAFPSGPMRMKMISKFSGSGYPEYFVKSTLKGKGVIYRGPVSTAELKGENTVKGAAAHMATSDPLVHVRDKSIIQSDGAGGCELGPSCESVSDGVTLREWMKSGKREFHKVDSLFIFKQILDMVYSLHSKGNVLLDLRPSYFKLSSRKVTYCGRLSAQMQMHGSVMPKDVQKSPALKRPLEQGMLPNFNSGAKHQKFTDNADFFKMKSQFQRRYGLKPMINDIDTNVAGAGASGNEREYCSNADFKTQGKSSRPNLPTSAQQHAFSAIDQLEDKWYKSPEEVFGRASTCSSNIYCLGVFLFELLSSFDTGKVHAAAMSDLRHRILPPNFLSENPKEAGFCLWLLHPEPSLRPTARDILQSEVVSGFQVLCGNDKSPSSIQHDEGESEVLLHFLMSMKEQKQKHAYKLVEDLGCIEADIKELEKRHLLRESASVNCSQEDFLYARERYLLYSGGGLSNPASDRRDSRFLMNVAQLESAYFSTRSQIQVPGSDSLIRTDMNVLKNRENWYSDQTKEEKPKSDSVGDFFGGLCKYARYSKLEVCGTVRNRDITNSTNVICSLSFDRDEDYFAAAGVSKKIKIFEFEALYDNSVDIHYPVIEMVNKSKLSSVCWNNYIRNYLASTDYDGIVKLWDASTGQTFSQYTEHEKRAWSVDFSQLDPTKFASGSDDCSVKLWSINERNSLHTIRNIANVCCVQFSAQSSHLLAFGSADYKIYCYDLRNANVPWCVLAGHEKAVSYVKFVDSGTLVSASTDNTLKLWDLNRSSSVALSDNACTLTLSGHTNEKNFVGLSVADGYIACGSETNEVFTYYKSLPMPITSHKFGSIDPISGKETDDDNGQFVSSVCWKGKSNVVVAANSSGCIKVLRMV